MDAGPQSWRECRRIHGIITPDTNIFKRDMKNKPDQTDSSLSETMAARIEIEELADPAHQKKITDAVEAVDGVIETKIEKGALHVSYDPLATTEKKIEQAIRSTGTTIKAAATDTEGAHPDLPRPTSAKQAPATKPRKEHS
jgi:copper chaperone CopZ